MKFLVGLLTLSALAGFCWWGWHDMQSVSQQLEDVAVAALTRHPDLSQVTVRFDHLDGRIRGAHTPVQQQVIRELFAAELPASRLIFDDHRPVRQDTNLDLTFADEPVRRLPDVLDVYSQSLTDATNIASRGADLSFEDPQRRQDQRLDAFVVRREQHRTERETGAPLGSDRQAVFTPAIRSAVPAETAPQLSALSISELPTAASANPLALQTDHVSNLVAIVTARPLDAATASMSQRPHHVRTNADRVDPLTRRNAGDIPLQHNDTDARQPDKSPRLDAFAVNPNKARTSLLTVLPTDPFANQADPAPGNALSLHPSLIQAPQASAPGPTTKAALLQPLAKQHTAKPGQARPITTSTTVAGARFLLAQDPLVEPTDQVAGPSSVPPAKHAAGPLEATGADTPIAPSETRPPRVGEARMLTEQQDQQLAMPSHRAGRRRLLVRGGPPSPPHLSRPRPPHSASRPSKKRPGHLGVQMTGDAHDNVVQSVAPGSAAEQSGIAVGDQIYQIANSPVSNFRDVVASLSSRSAGDAVEIWLRRNGIVYVVEATLTGQADVPQHATRPLPVDGD